MSWVTWRTGSTQACINTGHVEVKAAGIPPIGYVCRDPPILGVAQVPENVVFLGWVSNASKVSGGQTSSSMGLQRAKKGHSAKGP